MNSINKSVYVGKMCAYHPNQQIHNFCKNKQCLLPLCPTCVNLHSQQHKLQKTYGKFQNIKNVVSQISTNLQRNIKDLEVFEQYIKQNMDSKVFTQTSTRIKIKQSKQKVINMIENFFQTFQSKVNKSIIVFDLTIKQTYQRINSQINKMKVQISKKINSLSTDKVLKTIIGYYSKNQQQKINENLDLLRQTIDICTSKKISLVYDNLSIEKIINELNNHIYVSFQNQENQTNYEVEYIKTGLTNKSSYYSECSFMES